MPDVPRVDGKVTREPEFGETTTCSGCGGRVKRIVPRGESPGFGEPGYIHLDSNGCVVTGKVSRVAATV